MKVVVEACGFTRAATFAEAKILANGRAVACPCSAENT